MVKYTVIGGSSSHELAKKISRKLKASYVSSKLDIFPDGEQKITLSAEPEGDIIVVQSTDPPVDPNLIQMFLLLHKAREYSRNVFAVMPYMGYARQDREFLSGEIVTMKVVAKLLKSAGASKIFVVDIHSKMALRQFGSAGANVSAIPDLVRHMKKMKLRDPLIVSPDAGGAQRAEEFAKQFGADFVVLQKKRDRWTGLVKITSPELAEIKNRNLIIVDDMINTGGSIIKATEFLKRQGCRRVFVACTHALLVYGARKKIHDAGVNGIISANTVPGAMSIVDISGAIAKAIQNA